MTPAKLCFVFHAHLPFVRHPEHEDFLEEDWLFEAITESYVPLWSRLVRLADEGVPFGVTLTISSTLAAMLDDALLRKRLHRYIDRLTRLSEPKRRFMEKACKGKPHVKLWRVAKTRCGSWRAGKTIYWRLYAICNRKAVSKLPRAMAPTACCP